mmetsp:Transcript_8412/g.13436  ORF Transcript_8412/g.13436 Transcript_8412/m.13436 type:complete len:573 (+) Transcript_8412:37-1755(+)
MAPVCPSRGIRGRLRWAEPAGISSASDLETEDSVLSLAFSTDTAPSPSLSSRRRSPTTHRVRSCEARRRVGDGLVADLHLRCQNLEGETLILQRELRRLQELQRSGQKPAHVPLLPASVPVPPTGRQGTASTGHSCMCGLEATVAELEAELGAMVIDAQHERQRQASQIAKLESELQGGSVKDLDLVEEATVEFERWLSGQNAPAVGRASSSQSRCASEQKCASRECLQKLTVENQRLATGGHVSGSCSRPPLQRSSGSSVPVCSAGPLPPSNYRGSDLCSLSLDVGQQPTGDHIGFGLTAGFNSYPGSARFDAAEGIISFSQVDGQKFSGSDALFGPAIFSPSFGSTLASSRAVHVGELSAASQIRRVQPEQHEGVASDMSLHDFRLDNLPRMPSGPPPSRPPGLPMERPPPPPFVSQNSTPRQHSFRLVQTTVAEAPFEMKLTEANLREAMGALQVGSHPTSTRCTSVCLGNFGESAGIIEQATTACHTGRTTVEEISRGSGMTRDGGDIQRGCVENSSRSAIGLDEEVAMRLYQRFGLSTCMSFEKFVQLHEAHLPREKPLARPATGGA